MQDRFNFRYWDKTVNMMRTYDIGLAADGTPFVVNDDINNPITCLDNIVIMQCTGLKDKNGKLIYEGDIVKIFHVSGTMQGKLFTDVVEWNELRCRFDTEKYGVLDDDDTYEVIGNVYQNPELLENERNRKDRKEIIR